MSARPKRGNEGTYVGQGDEVRKQTERLYLLERRRKGRKERLQDKRRQTKGKEESSLCQDREGRREKTTRCQWKERRKGEKREMYVSDLVTLPVF